MSRSPAVPDLAEWHELTRAQSPLADAEWIQAFQAAFPGASSTVHAVRRGGKLVAGLAAVKSDGPARAWTSLDNEHNSYWLVSGEPDVDAADQLLTEVLADAEYLYLRRLPVESAACVSLVEAARRRDLPAVLLTSEAGDARMVLEGTWDELRARLPKNFQRDLPRKQRQLEKQGSVELEILDTPGPALAAALERCYEVETLGWKGQDGSPIKNDPHTLRFYTELAQTLAAVGRFALYLLKLDGKIIAFEYSPRGGGHIEMLKLSFDPAFDKQSPGQVLRMMLLKHELERGDIRYYHLGRPSEWKLRWATETAPLCTLRIYGKSMRARAAYLTGPVLRTRLKASPLAIKARERFLALRDRLRG
jgi:CelD/BcsL family acetyltransferase involved in cellulose biosynthesis